jgi:hypothetical protein
VDRYGMTVKFWADDIVTMMNAARAGLAKLKKQP